MNQLRLCNRSRVFAIHCTSPFLNPLLGKGNWLSGLIPRRKKPAPASDDLIVRPGSSDCGIEPQEHVQVIVHQRETTDRHSKDVCKFLQSVLEPLLTLNRQMHPI